MSLTQKHQLYLLQNKQQYNELKAALTEVAEFYQVEHNPDSAAIYVKVAYSASAGMYPHWERDLAFVVSPPKISTD